MPLDTMQDLLVAQLRDLYNAEKQITRALPRQIKSAAHESLAEALRIHLNETHGQIVRLEEIFGDLGVTPRGRKCRGMEGLLAEAAELMEGGGAVAVLDAGLIAEARRVEHYEIAAYTATIAMADALGLDDIMFLLGLNLDEEKAADERLGAIAHTEVLPEAVGATSGAEM